MLPSSLLVSANKIPTAADAPTPVRTNRKAIGRVQLIGVRKRNFNTSSWLGAAFARGECSCAESVAGTACSSGCCTDEAIFSAKNKLAQEVKASQNIVYFDMVF